jgi:excisionase family DNA binding protein
MPIGSSAAQPSVRGLLTPDEVAEWLHVSKSTVYRLVEQRTFPFYRVSGVLRFDRVDVETYLRAGRSEPLG